jgi:hypothetical protein
MPGRKKEMENRATRRQGEQCRERTKRCPRTERAKKREADDSEASNLGSWGGKSSFLIQPLSFATL